MVVSLGPGKFYGSSLPRPRIYTDVKFSDERVDPPTSVLDPLLAWATDAHWSMGGLNYKRLRHQGRIEGNVKKLVAERESIARTKKKKKGLPKFSRSPDVEVHEGKTGNSSKRAASLTPPPAPIAAKRRKYMAVSEEEDDSEEDEADLVVEEESGSESSDEEEEEVVEMERKKKKMPVRKLYDEFNKVARESKRMVESNGVGGAVVRDVNKGNTGEKSASIGGTRTSPRLGRTADNGSVAPIKTRPSRRLVKRG